jgi:biofilm PGA synthesis protein PgaD
MNINEVRDFIILAVVIFLGIFSITFMWSYYNKIRYRNKYRRTYPKMTTKEDLLELNILDEKDYEQLQNEKVIVFEKNPIKLVERK